MKVLLISINRCDSPYPVFPLGLGSLDAALREAGHEIRWIDAYFETQPIGELAAAFQPDCIGISIRNIDDVLINNREVYYSGIEGLCQELRRASPAPLVLGGSGFSIFPERLLEIAGADYGIRGEGERSFAQLLDALQGRGRFEEIHGLVRRSANELQSIPPDAGGANWPVATRPAGLAAQYLERSSMLNLQTQRGCPFHCCYCTYPVIEGRENRRREPGAVAEELERLAAGGARYIFIVDSVFNSTAEHAAAICEAVLAKNVKMRWGCFLRPKGLSRDLMRLMARAGLADIEFGTDSFCDPVLDAYGKRFAFDDVLRSSQWAHEEKVSYCHFLICGGPGETMETLREGYFNSLRLPDPVILALVGMRVYPGTPLHEQAVREGKVKRETDLLAPTYYLAEGLNQEEVFKELRRFASESPRWIVAELPQKYKGMAERLRQRGVVGPLWKYVPTLQGLFGASGADEGPAHL